MSLNVAHESRCLTNTVNYLVLLQDSTINHDVCGRSSCFWDLFALSLLQNKTKRHWWFYRTSPRVMLGGVTSSKFYPSSDLSSGVWLDLDQWRYKLSWCRYDIANRVSWCYLIADRLMFYNFSALFAAMTGSFIWRNFFLSASEYL